MGRWPRTKRADPFHNTQSPNSADQDLKETQTFNEGMMETQLGVDARCPVKYRSPCHCWQSSCTFPKEITKRHLSWVSHLDSERARIRFRLRGIHLTRSRDAFDRIGGDRRNDDESRGFGTYERRFPSGAAVPHQENIDHFQVLSGDYFPC